MVDDDVVTSIKRVGEQRGGFGDEGCKALTDMLRVNKHIRDVELQDRKSRSHDKFAALASATVAIESFTSKYGASCRSNVSVLVAPDRVRAQHMRPALPA